jgi:hypothetical protein
MTRKDYQKFAEMFAQVRADRSAHTGGMLNRDELSTIEQIEDEVTAIFSAENPLFDAEKFTEAINKHFHKISKY